jgi:hypothetical protein
MKVTLTKKATEVLNTLTKIEKDVYEYAVELITQDCKHIIECEKEKYFHEDKKRFNDAIKRQIELSFRAQYFAQITGLYIYIEHDTNELTVKTLRDK